MLSRSDGPPRRERQGLLFKLHDPKPRPLPKIDEDEATEIISREWRQPDGMAIGEDQARDLAGTFLRHLKYERRAGEPARLRKRPERPTAERLARFIGLETDFVKR